MKNNTKLLLLSISIFCTFLNPTTSHTQESNQWYNVVGSSISADGKWVAFHKKLDGQSNAEKAILVNTNTKERIEIVDNFSISKKNLLKNDFLVLLEKKDLSIIDLTNTSEKQQINNIKSFDTNQEKTILFALTEKGHLQILKLDKKKHKVLFEANNVKKYFINNAQTFLIYQDINNDKNLYKVDLTTYTKTLLTTLEKDLTSLQWNLSQDHILFNPNQSNDLLLINLNNNVIQTIYLPKEELSLLEKSFYSNNDLLITYNIATSEKYPESEYLDIWKGNSHQLFPSNFKPKYKFTYHAKIYKYDKGVQIDLERSRRKEYLPIPIVDHVVYYDPYKEKTYVPIEINYTYYIKNIKTDEETLLGDFFYNRLVASPDGKYIVYPKEDSNLWEVYSPESNTKFLFEKDSPSYIHPLWSQDSKHLFFSQKNTFAKLNLKTQKISQLSNFKEDTIIEIVNPKTVNDSKVVDENIPIILKVTAGDKDAIYKYYKNKISNILPFTSNILDRTINMNRLIDLDASTIVWIEQLYNLPDTFFIHKDNSSDILIKSDIPEELYNWQKRKSIKFKDNNDVELEGLLFYPKDFDPTKSYPMVTNIYDRVTKTLAGKANFFIFSTELNSVGYNRMLLNENGYFVFVPDTKVNDKGPGIGALENIEKAIKAVLKEEPAINKDKIGLSGHSFGGYKASFIATQTNLFTAVISNAGAHDLINSFYYRFNNEQSRKPEYYRTETGQFAMGETFAENPQKYLDNSPLIHTHRITTPILLFTGLKDYNSNWEQTRSMFSAIKRYNYTHAIALFYKNVGHSINPFTYPIEARDYTKRNMDWWAYYLKDDKTIKWIDDAVNPTKTSYVNQDFR